MRSKNAAPTGNCLRPHFVPSHWATSYQWVQEMSAGFVHPILPPPVMCLVVRIYHTQGGGGGGEVSGVEMGGSLMNSPDWALLPIAMDPPDGPSLLYWI